MLRTEFARNRETKQFIYFQHRLDRRVASAPRDDLISNVITELLATTSWLTLSPGSSRHDLKDRCTARLRSSCHSPTAEYQKTPQGFVQYPRTIRAYPANLPGFDCHTLAPEYVREYGLIQAKSDHNRDLHTAPKHRHPVAAP